MILQIDRGNSALKWRLCSGAEVLDRGSLPVGEEASLPALAEGPAEVWVASVAGTSANAALAEEISAQWQLSPWFAETTDTACGVTNSYSEPGRMGVDRWLAMIAAWQRLQAPVCVVDAGSALTIDFLDAGGEHSGGYILPGIAMMERSLLGQTARVRFGEAPRDHLEPGKSTEEAVFNGLQLAQVGAVATALDRYGRDHALVYTGGNGRTVMNLLDRGGDFIEDLVLDGLALVGRDVHAAEGRRA